MIQKTFFFLLDWKGRHSSTFFSDNESRMSELGLKIEQIFLLKSRQKLTTVCRLDYLHLILLNPVMPQKAYIGIKHIFEEANHHLFSYTGVFSICFSSRVIFHLLLKMYSSLHHLTVKSASSITKMSRKCFLLLRARLAVTRWCLWFDEHLGIQGDFVRNRNAMLSYLLLSLRS